MTDSDERACAQCRHAKHAADDIYECRLSPPETLHSDEDGVTVAFPLVMSDLWCGQFSRRVN